MEETTTEPNRTRTAGRVLLAILAVVYLVCFALVLKRTFNNHFGDFRHFYYAAKAIREHGDLYTSGDRGYLYPPLIAWLYSPVSTLSLPNAARVVLCFNVACIFTSVLLVAKEVARRFRFSEELVAIASIALLGTLLNIDKLRMELQMFQTNAIMFLMFALALRWLDRLPWLAGLPLGFIFNIKYLSLGLLPWLILRRRYGSAISFVVGIVAFALLPATTSGWHKNLADLRVAYGGLVHMMNGGEAVPTGEQANVESITAGFSVSITSAMARLNEMGVPMHIALALAGVIAMICLGAVELIYRRENVPLLWWSRPRREQISQPWRGTLLIEFSAIVAATLCFSPQTNTKHLLLAMLVTIPLSTMILTTGTGVVRLTAAIGAIVMALGFVLPPGSRHADAHQWSLSWFRVGGPSWCLLVAIFTLVSCGLWRARRLAAEKKIEVVHEEVAT